MSYRRSVRDDIKQRRLDDAKEKVSMDDCNEVEPGRQSTSNVAKYWKCMQECPWRKATTHDSVQYDVKLRRIAGKAITALKRRRKSVLVLLMQLQVTDLSCHQN